MRIQFKSKKEDEFVGYTDSDYFELKDKQRATGGYVHFFLKDLFLTNKKN